jgi:hypothetical protein
MLKLIQLNTFFIGNVVRVLWLKAKDSNCANEVDRMKYVERMKYDQQEFHPLLLNTVIKIQKKRSSRTDADSPLGYSKPAANSEYSSNQAEHVCTFLLFTSDVSFSI